MKFKSKILSVIAIMLFCFTFFMSCKEKNELKKVSENLTKYTISAELDNENMKVFANQIVEFVNPYEVSLNKICFNVYARAFRQDAVVKPYTPLNEGKCFPNGKSYGDLIIKNVLVDALPFLFLYIEV